MKKLITTYGRMELAQRYFPTLNGRSAWRKMRSWLTINPRLSHLAGNHQRTFSPMEVQLIVSELGEP